MPLALALCDILEWRFVVISLLGIVFGLLLVSHVMSAALFAPMLIGYAVFSRKPELPLPKRIASLLIALELGVGISGVYLLPLIAYQHLFELPKMHAIMPMGELGRFFVYLPSAGLSKRFASQTGGAACLSLVAAWYIWRAALSLFLRICMALTLLAGLAMMSPGFGPKLIFLSGLKVSAFVTPGDYAAKMLFTSFYTGALAILAYCLISKQASAREKWLLIAGSVYFVLMLPWAAPIWKAIPQLSRACFKNRFGLRVSTYV